MTEYVLLLVGTV
ncbi:electron transport complex, RnfABCDGE type, A subunit, partial [Vibrio parahaemolyticus VPTS-2010_2]